LQLDNLQSLCQLMTLEYRIETLANSEARKGEGGLRVRAFVGGLHEVRGQSHLKLEAFWQLCVCEEFSFKYLMVLKNIFVMFTCRFKEKCVRIDWNVRSWSD